MYALINCVIVALILFSVYHLLSANIFVSYQGEANLLEKSKKELNENVDRVSDDIAYIKDWIQKEPHLNARTDDNWLHAFLRGSKFSLQQTKEKIDFHYAMKTLLPELYKNRDPFCPKIQEVLKKGVILPLPKTEGDTGPRIIFMQWADCDPDDIPFIYIIKAFFMIMDILINEDSHSVISGVQVIEDYQLFHLNYIVEFTPSLIKKSTTCFQEGYPLRLKGVYICNAPKLFETVYNMIKLVMTEKIRNRTFIYHESNFYKVFDHIPQLLLTQEYGGKNGAISELAVKWKKKVESYNNWFKEEESFGTYEHLRAGNSHTTADLFGVEGTFRKLGID